MTIKQAEKLVCPFMSYQCCTDQSGAYETTCLVDK